MSIRTKGIVDWLSQTEIGLKVRERRVYVRFYI